MKSRIEILLKEKNIPSSPIELYFLNSVSSLERDKRNKRSSLRDPIDMKYQRKGEEKKKFEANPKFKKEAKPSVDWTLLINEITPAKPIQRINGSFLNRFNSKKANMQKSRYSPMAIPSKRRYQKQNPYLKEIYLPDQNKQILN